LFVIGVDALFYCFVMMMGIRYLFEPISLHSLDFVTVMILFAIGCAFPYCISYSHPVYHFHIFPLFSVFGAISLEKAIKFDNDKVVWSLSPLGNKKYAFYFRLLLFVYTQIEWVYVMWSRI
jgi:hypothetical protein